MIPQEKTKVSALTGKLGAKVDEWAVWYSGDTQRIANHYAGIIRDMPNGRFWSQLEKEERSNVVHEPLAADIAQVSASLLFSEPAEIQFEEEGKSGKRLTTFIEENRLHSKFLEGAELAASMGGVFLKLDTNPDVSEVPLLTTRTPEMAIASFKYGRLYDVTFWDVISTENDKVYRLFESRINDGNLIIEYGLFEGTKEHIGKQIDLEAFQETKDYKNVLYTGFKGLGCVYVPNMLPNRLYPGSSQGIADYADCISMMDSLDETMTSWIRDLTLGQARIFVDQELLNHDVPVNPNYPSVSETKRFDPFQRAYQKMDMSGWKMDGTGAKPIEYNQFNIRVDEHSKTANELVEKIVSRSGYAPQSFGLRIEGSAESGTALRMRERKSFITQAKKAKYWAPALGKLFKEMQQLDQATRLSGSYELQDVEVVPSDSIISDTKEMSETVRNLKSVEALSTYMSVKMSQPDWGEEAILEEVTRINEEKGAVPILEDEIGG